MVKYGIKSINYVKIITKDENGNKSTQEKEIYYEPYDLDNFAGVCVSDVRGGRFNKHHSFAYLLHNNSRERDEIVRELKNPASHNNKKGK